MQELRLRVRRPTHQRSEVPSYHIGYSPYHSTPTTSHAHDPIITTIVVVVALIIMWRQN